MKRILIVVVLVVIAAIAGLLRAQHSRSKSAGSQHASAEAGQVSEEGGKSREEIRKNYKLAPDTELAISGINGRVDIKTSDTDTAEVLVLRTASSRDSLSRRQVIIEQTSSSLIIRAEKHGSWWSHLWGSTPKEEVTITAPRRIALRLNGINGRVTGGEIEGALDVTGINGRVDVSQARGSAKISGINGNISVGLRDLDGRGVHASGVNGSIELRLPAGLNADLTAKGMNGKVRSDIPDVSVNQADYGSGYSARIGTGGNPINITGINGNVILTRMAGAAVGEKIAPEKKNTVNAKPAL